MAVQNIDSRAPANPGGARRDDFEDFPRDRWKRPKIIRAELRNGRWVVPRDVHGQPVHELVPYTRASTLGGALEYQAGLHRWKAAVSIYGVVRSRTLAKRARALDGYSRPDQKSELYEVYDKALAFAESDSAANHGISLHSLFQRIAEGESVDDLVAAGAVDDEDVPALVAFADALSRWDVLYCERRVVCDEAMAAGKYDLIVTARRPMPVTDKAGRVVDVILPGERIVVDNKTSSSADYFGEKFTVQLWIYAHGRDYNKETGERTEVGASKRWALILHIPSGTGLDEQGKPNAEGGVAEWHWVDLSIGEKLVRDARDVLEDRKLGGAAIVRADLDAEIPPELLERRMREVADGLDSDVPMHIAADADQALTGQMFGRPAIDESGESLTTDEICEHHGPHPGTVDCVHCIYVGADDLGEQPHYVTEEEYQRQQAGEALDHSGDPNTWVDAGPVHTPGCDGNHPIIDGMTCPDPYLPPGEVTIELASPNGAHMTAELAAQYRKVLAERPMPSTGAPPVREDLAEHLQRAATINVLLRKVEQAATIADLLDLFRRADGAGYVDDDVKAQFTARRLQLERRA